MNTDHVGPPVACNLVKLADVPEMEYYASSNQGEICVKGSNIFQGYFKDPETVSFDEHGWHHTGDIGMWLPVSVQYNNNLIFQYFYSSLRAFFYALRHIDRQL